MRNKLDCMAIFNGCLSIYGNGRCLFHPRFTQNKEEYKVPHERSRQDYSHKPGKTARSSFQIAPQIYCFWKHIKHCLTWLKTIKESFQNLSCEKQDRIKGAMLK